VIFKKTTTRFPGNFGVKPRYLNILNLIPIRRQEHILGAFMTSLLLMKTKLLSIAFLWGNKNS
jgi:hypothetical protein